VAQLVTLILLTVVLVLVVALLVPVVILSSILHPDIPVPVASVIPWFVAPQRGPAPAINQTKLPPPTGIGQVDVARRYLGVRYVFGGTDPALGLDCSGLVQLVYHQLGISLPRTAQLQYNATARVTREQLQPGDLVFFARTYNDPNDWVTHVGIYVGDGQQINAPTEGQVVSVQPVFSGFWGAHFVGGGRVATG
jgi:cell wall-associated NlpC family hydrolase